MKNSNADGDSVSIKKRKLVSDTANQVESQLEVYIVVVTLWLFPSFVCLVIIDQSMEQLLYTVLLVQGIYSDLFSWFIGFFESEVFVMCQLVYPIVFGIEIRS